MPNITIHSCQFPTSVKSQQEVWVVYHYLKEKLGGKKAPKIGDLIKELSQNWDKHYQEYYQNKPISVFDSLDTFEEKTLTTRYNHSERDTIAIAKFKKYIYSILENPSIDRKGLKKLLESYRV